MSEIEVVDGPCHNRISIERIGAVERLWTALKEELRKPGEHGINNNELKQMTCAFCQAVGDLEAEVRALPAQGRVLKFTGTDVQTVAEIMRTAALRKIAKT